MSLDNEFEREDPHWPAQLAILVALVLHIALPGRVTVIPEWIVPVAEGLLLVALVIARQRESPRRRALSFSVIGLVIAANTVTLGALLNYLLDHSRAHGSSLLLSGVDIFITNILIFAVLFWELDRGGPEARNSRRARAARLLLPGDGPDDEDARRGARPSSTTSTSRSRTARPSAQPTRCP